VNSFSHGVIVSMGHSNAPEDVALKAVEAGATSVTHLFNAMSGLSAREPGIAGVALTSKNIIAGLIVDMHHVSATSCKLAFDAKGSSGVMLVTDAMAYTGSDISELSWAGSVITRNGDRLTTTVGTIAGSCLDMLGAVRHCVDSLELPLSDALISASSSPARLLGLSNEGTLKVGSRAKFVQIADDLSEVLSSVSL
jgi:N-acetylglucosamine-6-phosphate deacetylase